MKSLLPVPEALRLVLANVPTPAVEQVPLDRALGRVSAESILAPTDLPSFDRAMMDGYAVGPEDLEAGRPLTVIESLPAGRTSTAIPRAGACIRIMTGAPVPAGFAAVVPWEKTSTDAAGCVILRERVRPGENIQQRGTESKRGEEVIPRGRKIRAAEIAALAFFGITAPRVNGRPRCAVLATGDELVEAGQVPPEGKIRNSNGPMLAALLREAGFPVTELGIAPDRESELREKIREGLGADVLLLSGGVSAGDRDLVLPCLLAEGVEPIVQQVDLKPGKPFFFGRRGSKAVFGLPGNPLSSFVTYHLFVRPFLRRAQGETISDPVRVRLETPTGKALPRTHCPPARLTRTEHGWTGSPLPYAGSGDIAALCRANGLIVIPPGVALAAGDMVDAIPFQEGI